MIKICRWDDELSEVAQIWSDQCAGVLYAPELAQLLDGGAGARAADFYPHLAHERSAQRATERFRAPPGVGQNVAWALTNTVNFTK